MKLHDILEQAYGLADTDIPQFNQADIIDAVMTKKPRVALKNVFPPKLYPKVIRWLENKIKDIEPPEGSEEEVGGEFAGKLDKYLEKDTINYESNAEALVRELLASYEEWERQKNKPKDFPDVRI